MPAHGAAASFGTAEALRRSLCRVQAAGQSSLAVDEQMAARPFFYAILTGAALLHALNRARARFSMDGLRVLADVALLVPVLVFIAASNE